MDRAGFNRVCSALPATTHVVQWGNSDVWKVGGKVFALCGRTEGRDAFTFKCSDIAFEVLQEMPGIRPAPYLAARGLKWLQQYAAGGLCDAELEAHIKASYDLVKAKLTQKMQAQLGLATKDSA